MELSFWLTLPLFLLVQHGDKNISLMELLRSELMSYKGFPDT